MNNVDNSREGILKRLRSKVAEDGPRRKRIVHQSPDHSPTTCTVTLRE